MLLEFEGRTRLYRHAAETIEARRPDEVAPALERLRGREAAGFIGYGAGAALEPKLAPIARDAGPGEPPLLWFGLFDGWEEVDAEALLPDPAGAWAGRPRPLVEREAHEAAIARALEHILDGDIYQANLTFPPRSRRRGTRSPFTPRSARGSGRWGGMSSPASTGSSPSRGAVLHGRFRTVTRATDEGDRTGRQSEPEALPRDPSSAPRI